MITAKQIKDKLTVERVVKLCCHLQGISIEDCLYDAQGHPIFNTILCHGGDSDKLYYYPETKLFRCYTCSSTYDIFELLHRCKELELPQAIQYIIDFFHFSGFEFNKEESEELISDWDIIQKYKDFEENKDSNKNGMDNEPMQENLLEYFYPLAAPAEWQKEGISPEVMRKYGIRVDSALQKIIIPHRNIKGELIGVRGRSFNPIEISEGKKYMPVVVQGEIYRHSLGKNLFGLYENQDIIRKNKTVCVFEAEKSVMQIATMYGIDKCFAVATCGSSISTDQMNLLLELGVIEVIIAFDADHLGSRGAPDTVAYEEKLRKMAEPLLPYVNVSIIFDYDHILPHKASPSDFGKEKFETLYHNRIRLHIDPITVKKSKRI